MNGSNGIVTERHLLVADSSYGPLFWSAFCRRGRTVQNLEYVALCMRPGQAKSYADRAIFAAVFEGHHLLEAYGESRANEDELRVFAADFESGCESLISDILQTDRHLGRGYYYSGSRHPLSPLAARANYWDSVALIMRLQGFYKELFRRESISAVVFGGIASLPLKLLCVTARSLGIDVRVIASGRVGNRLIWSHDEFFSLPQVAARLAAYPLAAEADGDATDPAEEAAGTRLGVYAEAARYQAWFSRRFSLVGLFESMLRDARRATLKAILAVTEKRRPKAGEYYFFSKMKNHVDVYLDYRRFRSLCDATWTSPGATPYVFLPLHVEPEASLTVFSPEFNCQIAVVDLIAKSLPAGITLVVKEHRAAIGRRPIGFYSWLSSIPGVVLAPLEANGPELARNSRVTVTITGTAGFEAAVSGVPVLTFGEHNFYGAMGHVHVVRDLSKLRSLLRQLIDTTGERCAYKDIGSRYLQSLLAASIDLEDEIISPDRTPSDAAIARIFNSFWSSLQARA